MNVKKGKAIPVTGREGPKGCGTSRLSHFIDDRLIYGGEAVSLSADILYPPRKFLVLISFRG
jgi:hypothetical protein